MDKWVHLNCALWSDEVYETVSGSLMNVETVLQQSLTAVCVHCNQSGATLKCYKLRCSLMYHLPCAVKSHCVFYKNKVSSVIEFVGYCFSLNFKLVKTGLSVS